MTETILIITILYVVVTCCNFSSIHWTIRAAKVYSSHFLFLIVTDHDNMVLEILNIKGSIFYQRTNWIDIKFSTMKETYMYTIKTKLIYKGNLHKTLRQTTYTHIFFGIPGSDCFITSIGWVQCTENKSAKHVNTLTDIV